jgi:cytochrome c oxidase cbb3-type subunit 1
MALDLTLAGVFQGYYWASLQPWEVSVDGSQPFWVVRTVAGLAMLAGQICFFVNLYMTWRLSREAGIRPALTDPEPQAHLATQGTN